MIKNLLAIVCLLMSVFVAPVAQATCGANGDEFELTFTETAATGSCDAYRLDPYPEVWTFPLPDNGPSCGPQVEPDQCACELDDTLKCTLEGGDKYRVRFKHIELFDGGSGEAVIKVRDSSGALICSLTYAVSVAELP
jgi:hypothetical protein